jgi:hypothetical protein
MATTTSTATRMAGVMESDARSVAATSVRMALGKRTTSG